MKVTIPADHRCTNGAEVARYLQELKLPMLTPGPLMTDN
jgi:hypothetical protein